MANIGIIALDTEQCEPFLPLFLERGASWKFFCRGETTDASSARDIDGVLIVGSNNPEGISNPSIKPNKDLVGGILSAQGLVFLQEAIDNDVPILGIDLGLQVLNLVLGGSPGVDVPGHSNECVGSDGRPSFHRIWISPGSKLAAVIGSGGIVRVNSSHNQGIREVHKAPRLIASAYSLEDGVIEGLESPYHTWILAVQCHPERSGEVPRQFSGLFEALVAYANKR